MHNNIYLLYNHYIKTHEKLHNVVAKNTSSGVNSSLEYQEYSYYVN